jgi:3-hydroxybutyryl-CoA dehydrogenase
MRIIGTHWWNPPGLVPLVEVIQSAGTSPATVAATMDLLASIGKSPAHVTKDVPGFVANRLQHALWREAIAMVAEGVCDPATLDACVKNSFGLRLAVLGPLENADLVGLDRRRQRGRCRHPLTCTQACRRRTYRQSRRVFAVPSRHSCTD